MKRLQDSESIEKSGSRGGSLRNWESTAYFWKVLGLWRAAK